MLVSVILLPADREEWGSTRNHKSRNQLRDNTVEGSVADSFDFNHENHSLETNLSIRDSLNHADRYDKDKGFSNVSNKISESLETHR